MAQWLEHPLRTKRSGVGIGSNPGHDSFSANPGHGRN